MGIISALKGGTLNKNTYAKHFIALQTGIHLQISFLLNTKIKMKIDECVRSFPYKAQVALHVVVSFLKYFTGFCNLLKNNSKYLNRELRQSFLKISPSSFYRFKTIAKKKSYECNALDIFS